MCLGDGSVKQMLNPEGSTGADVVEEFEGTCNNVKLFSTGSVPGNVVKYRNFQVKLSVP